MESLAEAGVRAAPWIFRRVILPLMDRRAFPRFNPIVILPVIDV